MNQVGVFPEKIIKQNRKTLLVNTYICLTGQDYEMFPINITWDFFFFRLSVFRNIFQNLP